MNRNRAQLAFETLNASTYLTAATLGTLAGYTLHTLTTPNNVITLLTAMVLGYAVAHTTRRILAKLLQPRLDTLWNAARPAPLHGQRVQLTTDIEAVGTRHQAGEQGTVHSSDRTDGYLIVRMDDGRTNFPHTSETRTLPATDSTRTDA
jgi:hypothetical protein